MNIVEYKKELLNHEGLPITENIVLFNDFEIYNMETSESVHFRDFEEALNYIIDNKTIKEIIESKEDIFQDKGGRGANYGQSSKGGRLFKGNNFPSEGKSDLLPSAYINNLTSARYKTVENTAKAFGKKFINEAREYAGLLDSEGFALEYAKGQKTSVIHLEREGAYSIHNHPSKMLNKTAKARCKIS